MSHFLIFLLLSLGTYTYNQESKLNADQIVNKCIDVHGGAAYKESHFGFDFRDKHYELAYNNGTYNYQRSFDDKDGILIRDILNNTGFSRFKNGSKTDLSEKKMTSYSNSVNSVHYFVYLPYFLQDASVNKKRLSDTTIKGEKYYQIKVTFDQVGGGSDFDDEYIYWIHRENYTMDYLAYSYHVSGGGVRFRSAFNQRSIGGIRWQDYVNYKYDKSTPPLEMAVLYNQDKLIQLSIIDAKNVEVLR